MSISLICWGVSLVILLPILLIGIFGGIRKGAYRSAVKLAALVFSVVLSLILTLCLRGILADLMTDSIMRALPEALQSQSSIVDLGAQISASAVLFGVYWLIFSIVRLLMLIPQKIVMKKLPQHPTQPQAAPVAPVVYAPESEAEAAETSTVVDPDFPLPEYVVEEPVAESPATNKVWWNVTAALCGVLSSLLFFSVWLMPISGIVTRGGTAVYRIASVLAESDNSIEHIDEVEEYARAISTAPVFVVTDLFTGKTIFEPLTTISTEFGKINLSKEIKTGTDILCQLIPPALHVTNNGTLSKEDAQQLMGAVESISQSDFMLSVGTWGANLAGNMLKEDSKSESSVSQTALIKELKDVLGDMTPEELSNDLDTLAKLAEILADSPVLKMLAKNNQTPDAADLADRETMRETFGVLYDNDHTRSLLIPLINLGTEFVFKSIGAKPVYSDANINEISRDQILEESNRLCSVAENISAFTQSMEGDKKLADYEMTAAGKALDSLRGSAIFGNQYSEMVHSVTSASGSNQNSALMESLGDAIVEAESAEKLMNSAQSVVIMSDALEDSSTKGREDKRLVSALDVLLNDTSPEDANSLSGIAGEHFLDNKENLDNETKKQMLDDSMKALAAVCAKGTDDVEAEADAVQTFRDITESKSSNVFEDVSEEKAVENFLNSKLAMEMLKNLNAENRDYGIREKLSDENKSNITSALKNSSADAAKKQVVGQFFGVN